MPTRFDEAEASISVLKDYMQTGKFSRGDQENRGGLAEASAPHRSPNNVARDELAPLLETAVEMRKRVTDQLAKILPAEFAGIEYGFKVKER